MRKELKSKLFLSAITAFALAAALGLAGCGSDGAGVEDVAEPSGSAPISDATATTGTDFEMTEAEMYEAYAGVTTDGSATAYYFGDANLTKGGLVLMNDAATEHVSYMGAIEVGEGTDGSTVIQITDSVTGKTIGFSVEDNADGTLTLDLGEDGAIIVSEVTPSEIIDAINTIQEGTVNAQ